MPLTPDFRRALDRLAIACSSYERATGTTAILVGGATATIYSAGSFQSGDFDLVAGNDVEFDQAMTEAGFVREHRRGRLRIGYYHPDHPHFGFQQVSGTLFGGMSDPNKLTRVKLAHGTSIVLPCPEDIIADRLGQHAVASPTDDSRLQQAIGIYQLRYGTIDRAYLERRIKEEGGDTGLLPRITARRVAPPTPKTGWER